MGVRYAGRAIGMDHSRRDVPEQLPPERIKEIRASLGLTQEEFARQVGVSFSTVSRWENGRGSPSRLALLQIARLQAMPGQEIPMPREPQG